MSILRPANSAGNLPFAFAQTAVVPPLQALSSRRNWRRFGPERLKYVSQPLEGGESAPSRRDSRLRGHGYGTDFWPLGNEFTWT